MHGFTGFCSAECKIVVTVLVEESEAVEKSQDLLQDSCLIYKPHEWGDNL